MENLSAIALLAAILVVSLVVASVVHRRAEREQARQRRIRHHAAQVRRLGPVIRALDVADADPELATRLNAIRRQHCQTLRQLDPQNPQFRSLEAEAAAHRHAPVRLVDSELGYTDVMLALDETLVILGERRARGEMDSEALAAGITHLRHLRALLDQGVVHQRGEDALRAGDRDSALREFRSALSLLRQSPPTLPGRDERVAVLEAQIDQLANS